MPTFSKCSTYRFNDLSVGSWMRVHKLHTDSLSRACNLHVQVNYTPSNEQNGFYFRKDPPQILLEEVSQLSHLSLKLHFQRSICSFLFLCRRRPRLPSTLRPLWYFILLPVPDLLPSIPAIPYPHLLSRSQDEQSRYTGLPGGESCFSQQVGVLPVAILGVQTCGTL